MKLACTYSHFLSVSLECERKFEDKKMEFHKLFTKMNTEIETECIPLDNLFQFLSFSFPELAVELDTAESIEEVLNIFSVHTSLINVFHMKAIACYFKLHTSIKRVQEYDDTLEHFCKEVFVKQLYGRMFIYNSNKPLLPSETIKLTLKSSFQEKSLYDIQQMLNTAFQIMVHHIMMRKIATSDNEISILCFAPLHLCGQLLTLIQRNEEELIKRDVLSISIAGCIVINTKEVGVKITV